MKSRSVISVLFCAGLATPVLAQSVQDGFYTNGFAELGYYRQGSNDDTLGYSEATIGYSNAASGLGAELGVDAAIGNGDSYSAFYGALTYQSSLGKLSFGAPRGALDAYLSSVPSLGGSTLLNLGMFGLTKRSYMSTTYLFTDTKVPLGLRYDGTFGAVNVGASYNWYNEINVYNLAANTQFGQTTVTGGIEQLSSNTSKDTRYFLGAESKFGQVSAGFLFGQNTLLNDNSSIEVYAKYKPMDQLELTATAVDAGAGSDTAFGLAADYTFNQGLYMKAGVADTFVGSSATAVNVALGLRF